MLTLVEDKKSDKIVGMYRKGSKSRKPVATVSFTHDLKPEKENVASAKGVLERALAVHPHDLVRLLVVDES